MAFEIETVESRIHDTWTEFKKYIDGTYMSLAFQYFDDGDFYQIVTESYGDISHRYYLLQDGGADDVDFTTNFQPLAFKKTGSFNTVTVFGGAAAGSTPSGNPVLVAGTDGTNVRTLKTDSTGKLDVTGSITATIAAVGSNNAAMPTSSIQVGGTDGTNLQAARVYDTDSGAGSQYTLGVSLRKTSSGGSVEAGTSTDPIRIDPTGTTSQPVTQSTASNLNAQVVGNVASGSALSGNPVRIGGSDGTNVRNILTDTSGRTVVVGAGVAGTPTGGVVTIQGVAGGTAIPVSGTLTSSYSPYNQSAFGELRVASNYTLADLINKYEIDTNEFSTSTATGGTVTHVANQSAINLAVTGSNGSTARLRTNTFYRYQAGKGLLIKQTVYHADTGQSNQVRRWGFFDDNDGIFWQLSGTTFSVVKRSSTSGAPVEVTVAQASFNNDILNGSGASGINLDLTKGNIFEIKLQWLGVGSVQFFVNGYLVHTMSHANTLAVPYMKTAQLPIGFDVINTGVSTGSSMTSICSSVIAEGGTIPPHFTYSAFNATPIVVTTTERPVLTIRPKATYNSIENRMLVLPNTFSIGTEGARISFRLVYNGTLTGASYTSVATTSGTEFDVAATALSGGETIYYGFLGQSNDAVNTINLSQIFGALERKLRRNGFTSTTDTLTVMAVNELSGSTNVRAGLIFDEIR